MFVRMHKKKVRKVLGALCGAISMLVPLGAALAQQGIEIQGELQIVELLDRVDTLVRAHSESREEFLAQRQALRDQLQAALDEMQNSEPRSPRFRVAKSEWARVKSQLIHETLVWSQQNVEQARDLVETLGTALGLIEGRLGQMSGGARSGEQMLRLQAAMIQVGAQIGEVLSAEVPADDARTQAALRSMMLGLHRLKKQRDGSRYGTFETYARLYQEMRGLVEAGADLISRNRVQLTDARAQADRLEVEIIHDLAINNIERLERHTQVLAGTSLLIDPLKPSSTDWDDFRQIEELESRSGGPPGLPPAHHLDTKEGFLRLQEGS